MFDDALEALASDRRRRVLFALLAETSRSDAAIVPDATGEEPGNVPSLEAYHVHLPKLADHGFIEWDREAGTVRRGPNFGEIRPLLELFREHAGTLPDEWVEPDQVTAWRPVDGDSASRLGTD